MVLDLLFKDGCVVPTSPMPVLVQEESNLNVLLLTFPVIVRILYTFSFCIGNCSVFF